MSIRVAQLFKTCNSPHLVNTGILAIDVNLKAYRKQKIIIGTNLINQIRLQIEHKRYDKIIVFSDSILKKIHSEYLQQVIKASGVSDTVYVKVNPQIKNFSFLKRIIDKLIDSRLNRGSAIVAVGGGTLVDLIGFVTSLYMRGIDLITIPTTFMAQCDTIIGKVGINYKKHKHVLGSFYSPALTFCDSYFLESLDKKEIYNGLVEVWKHALLKRDEHLLNYFFEKNFDKLEKNATVLQNITTASVLIKKSFVEKDYLDINGKHAALSLGHTFANYLERDGNIRHGEAILAGIIFSTFLSQRARLLSDTEMKSILQTATLFLQIFQYNKLVLKKLKSYKVVLGCLKFDKMNTLNSGYNFVVPTNKGYAQLKKVQREEIIECLKLLKTFIKDTYSR